MPRRTLLDFFDDLAALPGEFLVYDDGYRTWSLTYGEVASAARAFAGHLHDAGIGKGQAVAIWSEKSRSLPLTGITGRSMRVRQRGVPVRPRSRFWPVSCWASRCFTRRSGSISPRSGTT